MGDNGTVIEEIEEEGGPYPVYTPRRGRKSDPVQHALVVRLLESGLTIPEIVVHEDVTISRTKVYEICRYNMKVQAS